MSGSVKLPATPGFPPQLQVAEVAEEDMVGTRVRDRLTPKEMREICRPYRPGLQKNREIAQRLKTTEQVIKNYLRSIYDKEPASAIVSSSLSSLFITACWRRPRPRWAAGLKPKSSSPSLQPPS